MSTSMTAASVLAERMQSRQESVPAMATMISRAQNGSMTAPSSNIVSAYTWEVTAPPPVTSLKGALVPRVLSTRRRRKISVEVHNIEAKDDNNNGKSPRKGKSSGTADSYEECIVRVLNPASKEERRASVTRRSVKLRSGGSVPLFQTQRHDTNGESHRHPHPRHSSRLAGVNEEGEEVYDFLDHDDDEEDDEASTVADSRMVDASSSNFASPSFAGWEEKYRFPIRNISIKGTSRTGVFVQYTMGRIKQTRQLIFDTLEEAEHFRTVVTTELGREVERNNAKLQVVFHGKPPPEQDEITFLFEVVSGWDLPVGDLASSDPYVICTFNGRDVHKTQRIDNTLDPIWTAKTGSLFLFRVDPESLFLSEGMLFTVKDYDAMGAHESLGCFIIQPKMIYEAKGERMEFKLVAPEGTKRKLKHAEIPGYIAIRIRRATEYDINFMQEHIYKDLKTGGYNEMDVAMEQHGGQGIMKSYFKRQTRIARNPVSQHDIKQYKVRPGPDKNREEATTWMSKDEIEREVLKDSHDWIDIGSGRLGRLHVEVIGCNDLPNLDSGGRNKTDTFVALVYEDAVVKTDVIDDCLNPRWLPWSKRAAIFHIHHSSSNLYLGVFDFDRGISEDHDLVGRVSVDLANLRRDTIYVLTYDIYTSSRISDRKRKGSITVRLRLEIEDDRALLLSNLEPPPEFYVNTKTRKDFRVVNYTCTGKYDTTKYDIKYINSYIEEILATQQVLYHLNDGIMNLLLWRGTFPLRLFGRTFWLPVHSLSMFLSLVLVVERPQLAPAWFFGALGWGMIATMDYRLHTPDPWLRCKDFGEFSATLAVGFTPHPPDSIEKHENAEAAKAYVEHMRKRVAEAEEAAAKEYEENLKAQEEMEKEMEEVGDVNTDISTNRAGGFSVDPFKAVLFPVQQNLAMVCRYLRHLRWIVSWEECYIAYLFTLGCFLVSIIFLFVPWFFILKWSSRVVVWGLLGPWMKLVDIYYISKMGDLTEEELDQKKLAAREKRRLATAEAVSEARIKREKAAKLKAMKTYMFGKYISRIPVLKEDRFKDIPLSDSYAVPYEPDKMPVSEIAMQEAGYHRTRLPGQHLSGDMIPQMQTVGFTDAPIGQAIKQRRLVDQQKPAGLIGGGPESTTQAYIKIGSLVLVSSVISWFAVPFFSSLIDKVLANLQQPTPSV